MIYLKGPKKNYSRISAKWIHKCEIEQINLIRDDEKRTLEIEIEN